MSIKKELISLILEKAKNLELPVIKRIFIPNIKANPDKDAEFGLIGLADDSAGFFYTWLAGQQDELNRHYSETDFIGRNPIEFVEYYSSGDIAKCSIGLGIINAISQHLYKSQSYYLPDAKNSLGSLTIKENDHIGMVGYFPPLVKALSNLDARLTVIEKKEVVPDENFKLELSLSPDSLLQCNKVLITASTMLNNTLDEILLYSKNSEKTVLIGPSAGFLPDSLFKKGVHAIGGSTIINSELAFDRLSKSERVGNAARKYLITKEDYNL